MSRISDEQLVAYAAGELGPDENAKIADAIAAEAGLARRYAQLRGVVTTLRADESVPPPADVVARAKAIFEPKPAGRWLKDLKEVVCALVFDNRTMSAGIGLRSSGVATQLSYEHGEITVDLQLTAPTVREEDDWRVMGQVSPADEAANARVAFAREGTEEAIAEATLDEDGMFVIEVPAGKYDVRIGPVGENGITIRELAVQ